MHELHFVLKIVQILCIWKGKIVMFSHKGKQIDILKFIQL